MLPPCCSQALYSTVVHLSPSRRRFLPFSIPLCSLPFCYVLPPSTCLSYTPTPVVFSLLSSSFLFPPSMYRRLRSPTHASAIPLLRPLTSPTALFHAPCSRTYAVSLSLQLALKPLSRPTNHPSTYLLRLTHPSFPFHPPTLIFPSICTPRYYQLLLPRASLKPPRGTSRRRLPEEFSAKNQNSSHLLTSTRACNSPSVAFTSSIHHHPLRQSSVDWLLAWCTFALLHRASDRSTRSR